MNQDSGQDSVKKQWSRDAEDEAAVVRMHSRLMHRMM